MDEQKKDEPKITITFDPETQGIGIGFDSKDFKTWDFVVAILGIAKDQAEHNRDVARMQAMQQKAMAEHQSRVITRDIMKNGVPR